MTSLHMLIGLVLSLAIIIFLAILLSRQMLTRRVAISMQVAVLLVMGLALGGVPNPVAQLDALVRSLRWGQISLLPLLGLGVLLTTALIMGRAFCGYACPLGTVQELISVPVRRRMIIGSTWAGRIRWGFFILFLALAALTTFYPKWDPFSIFDLRWALLPAIAIGVIVVASLFIYRPWCELLCPFGALASLITRKSVFRLHRTDECTDCGRCVRACPTEGPKEGGTPERCYYCGRCIAVCPHGALRFGRRPRG
ncbi:MAG: 4Fe-4S binding protein [Methanomassiliicoccus sp.]|nr:4Fe-4S binding protein [Methanomassiliicoccus sp.]